MKNKVTIEKVGMNDKVLNKIIEIDKNFYLDFDYNDTSWYFNRYNSSRKITVLKVDNEIVGYYLFIPITKKLYEEICNLKYEGDYNFPESELYVKSNIEYIPSVLVKEEYKKYAPHLLMSLKNELKTKQTVVAIAISKEGHRMCNKVMRKVGDVTNTISVYSN